MTSNVSPLNLALAPPVPETVAEAAIASVPDIVAELRAGRMVVLIDEEDRENEGDLVMAAEHVSAEAINFMARFGRGLICLTLTRQRCELLKLPLMVSHNGSPHGTNFTVSIEAAEGVTTGISAADRARTVQAAVARHACAADLVQPGHIFPLMAQPGGVLVRAGHTEAGCDLAAMAGCEPAAVICEILKDDGSMARLPDLIDFAKEHKLKIGTIESLIHYRSENEKLVVRVGERAIRLAQGDFRLVMFRDAATQAPHVAIVHRQPLADQETLVRVHEPLNILDLLDGSAASHSWPLDKALEKIAGFDGAGVVVLLNVAQNADAVFQRFEACLAADRGDTAALQAMRRAAKTDLRTYGIGAQILRDLGVRKMRLLSNPRKIPSMSGFNLEVLGFVTHA
ncbi:MAG: 3,4-dihydroxy-2-butanone-4-phosphate synthase [Betaproteobacteria bacterium]|nr:3,4-dihydroxy-2-butanone-4-phosphate synthase [Pseudomonadota bacterium]NBO12768.1 3,4-dihydroxy-2-butanone-4-phosphate synthase [Betaproteobacteria bacterium]NBO44669.1 3,4-dihydroxy-2-butanone-4-phosphate synthase [Betaproteobacteria bacterium]NBP10990.1 3,4-dihydroxy-2-butanone-4-phosphate synthase [Betaproteobacteria bacterium]NBP61408.1 3,4-dihydroxy-2-butanone-4-phosphate synthase [Betaproteobacteria bacterium]